MNLSRDDAVVAIKAHNLKVAGSSPAPATKNGEKMFGEHRLKSGLARQVSFRAEVIRVAPR